MNIEKARKLRRDSTDAEKRLWNRLRDRQLDGEKFRRQHPFPPYILDFFCEERMLAIELDGGQHNEPEEQAYDQQRTDYLEKNGVKVIRFWNNEVMQNIEGVLE